MEAVELKMMDESEPVERVESASLTAQSVRLSDLFMKLFAYTNLLLETPGERPGYAEVSGRLNLLLDEAEKRSDLAGISRQQWSAGLFAVCAWIDERILTSDWPERDQWLSSQLQRTRFGTTRAGQEFFIRLARLGEADRAVREVYAYCLALGFKGRYYRPEDRAALQEIGSAAYRGLEMDRMDLFPSARHDGAPPRRKGRRRFASLFTVILIMAPVALFLGLFVLYKSMLGQIISDYLKSVT